MEYSNDLYHWGIKGMKWGQRRYQNKDGSLTPAGKKRYDREMEKIKAETKRIKNQQRTDAKLRKLEEARKNLDDLKNGTPKKVDSNQDIEAKKEEILNSRSPKALYDNANLFTYNELNAAKTRLVLEADIKKLEPPAVDKGKRFADNFIEKANTITSAVDSGSKAWNSVAKVFNSLYGNKNGITLPLISDKTSSKIEKFKEETEWIKAKNERKNAEEARDGKPKTELEKLKEETAFIDAQNKNREAKRASRAHDESDRKEQQKKEEAERKEQERKEAAERKEREDAERKKEMEKYEEVRRQYADPQRSGTSTITDSEYRSRNGERNYTDPNQSRGLALYNKPVTAIANNARTESTGKTYTNDHGNTVALSTNVATRINTMTSSGKYTNTQIAERLGVSPSTVSRYSNGKKQVERLMSYDEDGNFIGYWSERMISDGII